ncbi:MAG: hypothetical protein EG824_01210 [Deltaproteobacteria bacterium]|nr:hypothetical protein [Deltaproteobacteria bacterium]
MSREEPKSAVLAEALENAGDVVEVKPAQIDLFDKRIRQVEQVTQTIESISKSAIEAATNYLQSKAETERREVESQNARHEREIALQDKLHKRSIGALAFIVTVIAILVGTAVVFGEAELAKTILITSFAIAGGAGIRNLFRTEAMK